MPTETLVFATDPATVTADVEGVGGRLIHALTANLLVIALPDTVAADSIRGASIADPAALDGARARGGVALEIRPGVESGRAFCRTGR